MPALSSSDPRARTANTSHVRVRVLGAAAALGLLALAVWLVTVGLQPQPGTGFTRVIEAKCAAEPAAAALSSVVREPSVLAGSAAHGCERWTAFWAVRRLRRSLLEMDASGRAELSIDGRRVGLPRGHHGLFALSNLQPGVHRFELRFWPASANAYLRLRELDSRDSYYPYVVAPLQQQDFFVQQAGAERALFEPVAARSHWPVLCLCLLLLACTAAWLSLRAQRGRTPPWLAMLCVGSVIVAAYGVRIAQLPFEGTYTDELAYATSGRHYVRNVQLGDFSTAAFQWNFEHPPVAKWIYGLSCELGDHDGARHVSALLAALACGLTVVLGALLVSLRVGVSAGALCAFMPHLVAHARLTGLESPVVFFWMASLVAAVCWARSTLESNSAARALAGDAWAAFFMVALAVLGLGSRMTCVWLAPILLCVLGYGLRHLPARRCLVALSVAAAGGMLALLMLYALWPWLWSRPVEGWHQILARWGGQHTSEFFMGENRRPPPPGYYFAAFAATTPLAVLALGLLGAVIGVLRRSQRVAVGFLLLCLLTPFAQSLSAFRQDLARYVIPSWFALALLAALGVEACAAAIAQLLAAWRGERARLVIAVAGQAWLAGYVALALARIEPYPLDYFSELVGGPTGVAATRSFELAWWGEGIGEAVGWVNDHAPRGARFRSAVVPSEVRPRLRDDLVEAPRGRVDFVITNHYKFQDERPAGCALAHRVAAQGAALVDVYRCAGP